MVAVTVLILVAVLITAFATVAIPSFCTTVAIPSLNSTVTGFVALTSFVVPAIRSRLAIFTRLRLFGGGFSSGCGFGRGWVDNCGCCGYGRLLSHAVRLAGVRILWWWFWFALSGASGSWHRSRSCQYSLKQKN